MKSPRYSNFLRILVLPRMVGDFKYETLEKDLFFKISDSNEKHGNLVSSVLLDKVNKKFWIEAGVYRNITTFKAQFIEGKNGNFIRGSFTNSGTLISYPILISAFFGWVYFLVTNENGADMFFYLIFFAVFHLIISISFNNQIKNILIFLENELHVHPSQSEIISNPS